MTVAAARALGDDDICFVGIGLPSAACNLARLTHAPGLTLVYESGTLETKPTVLPLSIGDGELCETALTTVSVPEMFQVLAAGRTDFRGVSRRRADRSLRKSEQHRHRPYDEAEGAAARQRRRHRDRDRLPAHLHRHASQRRERSSKTLTFMTSLGHGPTGRERRALGHHDRRARA